MHQLFAQSHSTSGFLPSRDRGDLAPVLIGLHNVSDALLCLAYLAVLCLLIYFVRRHRDSASPWAFWLFAVFMLACGLGHFLDGIHLNAPILLGVVKLLVAMLSWLTVLGLAHVLPKALVALGPVCKQAEETNQNLADERDILVQRLQLQIECLPLGYLLTDADFRYTHWNPAAERIFGFTQQEVLGKHPFEVIVPSSSQPLVKASIEQLQADDLAAHGCCENVTRDGRIIICEWHNIPLLGPDGKFVGLLSLAQDITERKRLEEQFSQAQKMQAVGQLAGGVVHEFNNLLTVINGYCDLVMTCLEPASPVGSLVNEISRAGERAADLTRQLLVFSRKQVEAPTVLDLNAIILEMEPILRRLLGGDLKLVVQLEPALGLLKADPAQVQQILLNLTGNARDALLPGGKLTIETRNVEFANTVSGQRPGSFVMLQVSDTGQGMTAEVKARIFEPFFTTKGVGKGMGLGLATVFSIVTQHSGQIEVDSQPGIGTVFRVYFPRHEGTTSDKPASTLAENLRGTETVLLAEDEKGIRSLASRVLQEQGYTVLEARDAAEALRKVREHSGPLHLLISDLVMPEGGGRHLAEQIQSLRSEIKILFISGYMDDATFRQGVRLAETNFLQKPFLPQALLAKVREVLQTRLPPGGESRPL